MTYPNNMTKIAKLSALILLHIFTTIGLSKAQQVTTTIKITGIRSTKGKIVIAVFRDQQGFDQEKAWKNFVFDKNSISNRNMTVAIKLDPGTYGLTLMDDENANGKMEKNFIGIPKEGFGFSNFFLQKMKKPVFDDFKVQLKADQNKVDIKVKYM